MKSVLLVDDADETRILTRWFLTWFGYMVDSVRSAEDAVARFDPMIHDAVVTDNRMPGMSGEELCHIIKMRSPATPLIMYTGMAPEDRSCVDVVIQRPSHLLVLKNALDELLGPPRTEQPGPAM